MNKILKVLGLLFLVVYSNTLFFVKTECKETESANAGVAKIISNDLLNEEDDDEIEYTEYEVPTNNGFKSFMPHSSITDKSSKQYKMQNDYAYTDDSGFRKVDGRYCIAIGTAFNADIGDYADLILENGEIICVIIADLKADIHTDNKNIATKSNGCVSEFIVDSNQLNKYVKKHGDISHHKEEWNSPVIKIKIYNQNIFKEETK